MTTIFVIQNQNGHYWGKAKEWVDGRDKRAVWRSEHKDEVVNLIFELSSKDIGLRAQSLQAELDDSGNPVVQASAIPLESASGKAVDDSEGTGDGENTQTAEHHLETEQL